MEAGQPLVLTVVRPPVDADEHPWLLTTVDWVRPLAHVKHAGTFGQIYIGAAAERAGYDDAVLVTPGGRIAETTVGNIGFVAGDTVVWPQAPNLPGITRQLLDLHLRDHGCAVVSHPVTCETLDDYDGAFVTNSTGIRAVAGIDGHRFSGDGSRARWLREQYESIPADVI
jgi:branched-subunit amino acid aminotransferase/4-amino-4-deoxychorismate lyase